MDLLRHLACFVAVAEELHFGRAADRLHMAQSPLSRRIRALEERLGVELLVRTTRSVELTPAGRTLLDEARAVLGRAERLEATMTAVATGAAATLRVAVGSELPASVLPQVMGELGRAHPEARLVLVELDEPAQRAALVDRRLDLALLRWPVPALVRHGAPLRRDLGVLLAAGDPQAGGEQVELGDLGDGRTVVLAPREDGPEDHDATLRACHAQGLVPGEVLAAAGVEFAAGLVLASGGVALIGRPAHEPAGTVWRPVAGRTLGRRDAVAWRPDDGRPVVADVARLLERALVATGGWVLAPPAPATAVVVPSPRPADAFLG